MYAVIGSIDCFGKVKISFSQKISIERINSSFINSSNTEIGILPYVDWNTNDLLNLTKFTLRWTTTKLAEYELEIQLEFEEPDSISR